jgi:hypothetical protein
MALGSTNVVGAARTARAFLPLLRVVARTPRIHGIGGVSRR